MRVIEYSKIIKRISKCGQDWKGKGSSPIPLKTPPFSWSERTERNSRTSRKITEFRGRYVMTNLHLLLELRNIGYGVKFCITADLNSRKDLAGSCVSSNVRS
jgi:hypothetical protein